MSIPQQGKSNASNTQQGLSTAIILLLLSVSHSFSRVASRFSAGNKSTIIHDVQSRPTCTCCVPRLTYIIFQDMKVEYAAHVHLLIKDIVTALSTTYQAFINHAVSYRAYSYPRSPHPSPFLIFPNNTEHQQQHGSHYHRRFRLLSTTCATRYCSR